MIGIAVEHVPVLLKEVLEHLRVRPGGVYVDCTLGLGGHAEQILERLGEKGQLIALERDRETLRIAEGRLRFRFSNFRAFHENFKNLPHLLGELGVEGLAGCLADLGISSHQLETPERGFSFLLPGPLDMRMDSSQQITAADLVNRLPESGLADLLRRYGEERAARKIARAIVQQRRRSLFQTTSQLAELVEQIKGWKGKRIHPATQTFQALRIEVNQELTGLEEFFHQVMGLLAPGGRLVVVSFHSLEDRIVKTALRKEAGKCVCFRPVELCTCPRTARVRILTAKPLRPSPLEIQVNPRSRSARLRVAERLGEEISSGKSVPAKEH